MSVIVMIKDKDRFIVGCDTRICSEKCYLDGYKNLKKSKHIDINREIIKREVY